MDGESEGWFVGLSVGLLVGDTLGLADGFFVGDNVGRDDGKSLAICVGDTLGLADGLALGETEGVSVGEAVGDSALKREKNQKQVRIESSQTYCRHRYSCLTT